MKSGDYTINPQSAFGEASTETLAADKNSGLAYYKSESRIWKGIGIVSVIVSFIALALGTYSCVKASQTKLPGTVSCLNARGPNGIYYINTDSYFNNYPVYCDMETDGGGWTLVAAVHENNIRGKCTNGDVWSSDQGFLVTASYNGSLNWENKNMFGTINSLSNDDYKNMAYYTLAGKNVMIWHVPNLTPIAEFSSKAFLKYYTTNNFLTQYGGTLQSLYKNYAPLIHAGPSRFYSLIAAPVVYAKGSNETIMAGIPNSQKFFVQPGFIQFRAFDPNGFPNALCPGVRMISGNSAQVCIGGGGVYTRTFSGFRQSIRRDDCGDFAGWNGFLRDPGSQTSPSDSGRSKRDINSSIFIFVR